MKSIDERVFNLRLELAKEKKAREEMEEAHSKDLAE